MDLTGLPVLLINFVSYKLNIQGCSALTVEEYLNDLRYFFTYAAAKLKGIKAEEVRLEELDAEFFDSIDTGFIYTYLLHLSEDRDNKPATRARRLSSVKAFYKYHTTKSAALKNNPAKDIDSPKLSKKLPIYLSLEESLALLNSFDRFEYDYERNFCILTLFLNCGMRLAELVGIDLSDLDSELEKVVVTGKGDKERTIYLNSACKSALRQYLKVRQSKVTGKNQVINDKDKDALFLSGKGLRISNKTVQWLVKRQLERSGLDKKYSVHKLRHTAATLLYERGHVDVRVLQEILGHEQLNTTQIYTHVSSESMKSATSANPLAEFDQKKKKNQKEE